MHSKTEKINVVKQMQNIYTSLSEEKNILMYGN